MRLRRIATACLAMLALGLACGPLAATADATPVPFLALDCEQEVWAFRDQPVVLSRLAVLGYLRDAVRTTPKLGTLTAVTSAVSFQLGLPIEVGTVGDQPIPGTRIADAVAAEVGKLAEIAPARDAAVAKVRALVAAGCGMTVHALNGKAAEQPADPSSSGTSGTGSGQNTSGTTGTVNAKPVGGYTNPDQLWLYDPAKLTLDTGRAARRDYGAVPAAVPGLFAPSPATRYGGTLPGYDPRFGILGATGPGANLRTVGDATALPGEPGEGIALPVLLAVLALSVVTGTLVRTWVLRRA